MRGSRVLVTGAGGGIGRHACDVLRFHGAFVVGADLDPVAARGHCDSAVALDVTDDTSVSAVVGEWGPWDALVLGHGITSLGPAVDTPMSAIDRVLDVNLRGAIAVTQAALPDLVVRRGRIAVLSSVSGFAPLVHRTAYSASKHGLHGYFESLRAEVSYAGVSVTIVAPSFVGTGIETRAAYRAAGTSGDWSTTGEVIAPHDVAVRLVEAMALRRSLVLPSRTARAAYLVSRLAPGVYARTMRRRVLGGK